MAKLARNSPNTLVFRKVTIRFRRYPGVDAAGALGGVPYVLRAGIAAAAGLTRPDGSITLRVPSGGTALVEIFGLRYEIGQAAPPPPADVLGGVQRRLNMTGYRTGPAEGKPDPADEAAVLDFQADHDLDPRGMDNSGLPDEATRRRLEAEAGA